MLRGIVDSLNRGTDDVYFRIDIGSEFSIASWDMHVFENGDEITYSKTSDPEYYEILSILANAKLTTDVSDCAVVSVYGLVPSDASDLNGNLLYELGFTSSYQTKTCSLAVSNVDYQRIRELVSKHFVQDEYGIA